MENKMTKKSKNALSKIFCPLGILILASAAVYIFFAGNYNKIVSLDEEVLSAWSQVENQYQRRLDLIPNLVSAVKGYANHEESLFTQIAEKRSEAGGTVSADSSIIENPEKLAEYQKIQNELGASLQRLLAVTENYPELKSSENFLALQDELSGTENRISVERMRYNDAAKKYNTFIRKFPAKIVADMNHFEKKSYFESDSQAKTAPKVEF